MVSLVWQCFSTCQKNRNSSNGPLVISGDGNCKKQQFQNSFSNSLATRNNCGRIYQNFEFLGQNVDFWQVKNSQTLVF